jgi:hypothetical protein
VNEILADVDRDLNRFVLDAVNTKAGIIEIDGMRANCCRARIALRLRRLRGLCGLTHIRHTGAVENYAPVRRAACQELIVPGSCNRPNSPPVKASDGFCFRKSCGPVPSTITGSRTAFSSDATPSSRHCAALSASSRFRTH